MTPEGTGPGRDDVIDDAATGAFTGDELEDIGIDPTDLGPGVDPESVPPEDIYDMIDQEVKRREALSADHKTDDSHEHKDGEPTTPEKKLVINEETEKEAFMMARDKQIKDPLDKTGDPEEITLLNFLLREFADSYKTLRERPDAEIVVATIGRVVATSMGSIEAIRSLAEACRSNLITHDLAKKLNIPRKELDALFDQTNDYANSREIEYLKSKIQMLEDEITETERTGNEIYHFLMDLIRYFEDHPGSFEIITGTT